MEESHMETSNSNLIFTYSQFSLRDYPNKRVCVMIKDDPNNTNIEERIACYFVIRIDSTIRLDKSMNRMLPSTEELISLQAKFVASFRNNDFENSRRSLSIRMIGYPDRELPQRGAIKAGLICKLGFDNKEAIQQDVIEYVEDLLRILPAVDQQIYQFSLAENQEEFNEIFFPFKIIDIAEICRREQVVKLGPQKDVYIVYPFRQKNTFENLAWQILKAPTNLYVDVSVQPTSLFPWERKKIEETIDTTEMYSTETEMQSANADGRLKGITNYKTSYKAEEIRNFYRYILHQLDTQAYQSKIHVVGERKLSPSSVTSIGLEFSGFPGYDHSTHMPFGGNVILRPLNKLEFEQAVNNVTFQNFDQWNYSIAPRHYERFRQLFGVDEAVYILRIPIPTENGVPGFAIQEVRYAPLPANIPLNGIVLGESLYTGIAGRSKVRIKDDDRRRHMYIVGKTGTGKSTLIMQMAIEDIKRGAGICVIDPHGELVEDILLRIPPSRAEDVVLFDPSDTERPIGLNLLETRSDQETHLIVNEIIGLMYKLYDPRQTGIIGPRFEHAIRNAMLTVMTEPGNTLIEVVRILTSTKYVQERLAKVTDPLVRSYWQDQISQTSDFHKSEVLDYIVSKFGRFVTNKLIRNIIGQSESSFDYRKLMDEKKIFLVNLSKGKIGPENSNFLGRIIVPKLLISALSRIDKTSGDRPDFYLYVDEFQNFASETFATMLSEARKYGLSITLANQYLSQLGHDVLDSVFGNVGTLISFRMGIQDVPLIQREFYPIFDGDDLVNLPKYTTCIKLLVDGMAARQFSMRTILDKSEVNYETAALIRQLSRVRYGRDRQIVEEKIDERMGVKKK